MLFRVLVFSSLYLSASSKISTNKIFYFLVQGILDLGLEMILLKVWGNRDQYPQSAVKEIELGRLA